MRHLTTKEIPARTKQVTDYISCDLCKDKIVEHDHQVDEVDVSRTTGYRFPGSGQGTITSFDLCGKCFEEKLIPWLRDQGAEPLVSDWDF